MVPKKQLNQKRCHEERDQKVNKVKQTIWAATAQQLQEDNHILKNVWKA
jgi:hypothetical protein